MGLHDVVVNDENDLDGMFAEEVHFAEHLHSRADATWLSPLVAGLDVCYDSVCSGQDEYAGGSYTDQRGYYDAQNTNTYNNPIEGFVQQPSIMASGTLLTTACTNHTSSRSSFEMSVAGYDADGYSMSIFPYSWAQGGRRDSFIFEAVAW